VGKIIGALIIVITLAVLFIVGVTRGTDCQPINSYCPPGSYSHTDEPGHPDDPVPVDDPDPGIIIR
jgi:hypothetical protein